MILRSLTAVRVQSWVSLALSLVAFVLGLAAIALASHWDVRFGDVGGWIAGLGAFIAAFVALAVAVRDNRIHRTAVTRERRRVERRAVREAESVVVSSGQSGQASFKDGGVTWGINLHNQSDQPIYGIRWFAPSVFFVPLEQGWQCVAATAHISTVPPREASKRRVANLPVDNADPFTLLPGELCTVVVNVDLEPYPGLQGRPYKGFERVSYEDEAGNRLGRIHRRTRNPTEAEARFLDLRDTWSVVDDDYPASANDGVGEIGRQARPPAG